VHLPQLPRNLAFQQNGKVARFLHLEKKDAVVNGMRHSSGTRDGASG
jgi:hypothetical protein